MANGKIISVFESFHKFLHIGKGKTTAVVNDDENNAKTSEGSPKKGKGKNSPSKKGKGVSCGKSSKKR